MSVDIIHCFGSAYQALLGVDCEERLLKYPKDIPGPLKRINGL